MSRPIPSSASPEEKAVLEFLSTKVDPIFVPLLRDIVREVCSPISDPPLFQTWGVGRISDSARIYVVWAWAHVPSLGSMTILASCLHFTLWHDACGADPADRECG